MPSFLVFMSLLELILVVSASISIDGLLHHAYDAYLPLLTHMDASNFFINTWYNNLTFGYFFAGCMVSFPLLLVVFIFLHLRKNNGFIPDTFTHYATYVAAVILFAFTILYQVDNLLTIIEGAYPFIQYAGHLLISLITGGVGIAFMLSSLLPENTKRTKIQYGLIVCLIICAGIGIWHGKQTFAEASQYASPTNPTPTSQKDQKRINTLTMLQDAVANYAIKHKQLPQKLTDALKPGFTVSSEYTYRPIDTTSYSLCTTFDTSTQSPEEAANTAINYHDNFYNHPKGNMCFRLYVEFQDGATYIPIDFRIPFASHSAMVNGYLQTFYTISKDQKAMPLVLNKDYDSGPIASVSASITDLKFSNFPDGFFSKDPTEHGLINYADEPVDVRITFRKPVQLASITTVFSHCPFPLCDMWSADGVTADNTIIPLVDSQLADDEEFSEASIATTSAFVQLRLTAARLQGSDYYLHWKKIYLEYK